MDYYRIYTSLINKGKNRELSGDIYSEKHHIIPECMGGSNDESNLVKLTAKEHFVAHHLLWKIHPKNEKLFFAFKMMATASNHGKRKIKCTPRLYEKLRKEHSSKMRNRPQEVLDKISKANKGRKQSAEWVEKRAKGMSLVRKSDEQKQQQSDMMKERIRSGWKPNTSGFISGQRKGQKHSLESKRKMSEYHTGNSWEKKWGKEKAEQAKEKHRLRMSGENNHLYKKFDAETASKLLLETELTCEEIAATLKMSKVSFFSKFKSIYDSTPQEYRRKNRTTIR